MNSSEYWKQQLACLPPLLELPVNYPRSSQTTHKSAHLSITLSKSCRDALKELSRQSGVTLFMTLLASYKTLLYRYTGQEDIVIGYPITRHTISNSGELKSYLLNTLALRSNLSGNPRFSELMERIREVVLSAYAHKDLSFELLIEALEYDMVSKPDSLSQVMFKFQNGENPQMEEDNFTGNPHRDDIQLHSADLTLSIEDTTEGLVGVWEYNAYLFDAATIERMAGHFQILLKSIVDNPKEQIARLPLLNDEERHQLLFGWNNSSHNYPDNKCIHELFEEQVERTPNALALIFEQEKITYKELNERANQLAHYLRSKGVKPETLVPICMDRSLKMIIGILGVIKAGGAYVPIDPAYPSNRIQYMLKDTDASIIVSTKKYAALIDVNEEKITVVDMDNDRSRISDQPTENPVKFAGPSNLAYIIYTSGSTGIPKGVMIEHRNVNSFISWCAAEFSSSDFEIVYASTSICFDLSVFEIFYPLSIGKPVRIIENGLHIGKYLPVDSSVLINSVPSIIQNLLHEGTDLSHIKVINMAGEPIPLEVQQGLDADNIEVRNLYGPTEDTTYSTIFRLKNGVPITIGRPISNTNIYISNKENQLSPVGVVGEILISGAGLARGYLNRPDLTAEKFVSNPFSDDTHERVYKTGDLGRYLNDGSIVFLGRMDHQVKIRGYRIELGEIESALMDSEWLHQAVVLAREDKENKRLIAYYVPKWPVVKAREHELYERQVQNWKEIYEAEYASANTGADEEFDVTIWKDSFTGKPIGEEQMREWLQDIVSVILSQKTGNVLEIGCGTGLIYFQLAGKVNKYTGTDFSSASISHIRRRIDKGLRDYGPTRLQVGAAHEIALQNGEQADTIVLNSIVQYFPGEQYMNEVMKRCMSLVKSGGRIIIGDVRDNRLLELFKTRLLMQKMAHPVSIRELTWAVEQEVLKEEELCLSPAYFYRLRSLYPQISHIEITWKECVTINELTLYRYTVVIQVGAPAHLLQPDWQNWKQVSNADVLRQLEEGVSTLAFKNVPNCRLWQERLLSKALSDHAAKTVGDLSVLTEKEDVESLEVKDIHRLAKAKGYHIRQLLHEDPLQTNLVMELHFSGRGIDQPAFKLTQETGNYTNIPLFSSISLLLQKDLKALLKERLPEYMIPSVFVSMKMLPLTPNRKVDRSALPVPDQQRHELEKTFVAPRDVLELQLTKIFEKCLQVHPIGVQDNFFELGANSLQAGYIFSRIKKTLGKQLHLSTLLQAPTIEQLAVCIRREEKTAPWSSLVPIQPKGSKPPLFCIHGGIGTVLFYKELADSLGSDQPFYGLQAKGLHGIGTPHTNIQEMATDYIKEIRTIQHEGPYHLGGYCFGGLVAFEMAKQLIDQGDEVALLANFNAVSPTYVDPSNQIIEGEEMHHNKNSISRLSRIFHLWKQLDPLSIREKLAYVFKMLKKKLIGLKRLVVYIILYKSKMFIYNFCLTFKRPFPDSLARFYLFEMNANMIATYRPKPYVGQMVIFRSPLIYGDPHLGWTDLVEGSIETCDIAGEHDFRREIFNEPSVHTFAKELKKYIGTKKSGNASLSLEKQANV